MGQSEKKQWQDLTPRQQQLIIVGGALEAILTTVSLVDLARRDRAEVRGPKLMWVAACVVQPVGPIAYWVIGRRRS
ncbi:MAG: PLD nuclease N-terminal domain-containing protein [Candidatus Nanopelagicales bacterium]